MWRQEDGRPGTERGKEAGGGFRVFASWSRLVLRRLMRNCEEQRRSQDRMLMHQTLSKGWCHARSPLLLGLIVRVGGRLVEARALFGATESRPSGLAYRPRGHHAGHPRPVAPLQKRARFLALRSGTTLRPYFPKLCSQSQLNRRVRSVEP